MHTKTALITGITGQDGSYLAEFLLDKGYRVCGIVRRASTENSQRIEHIREHLELFQADGDPQWLEWAVALQRRQNEVFWDAADGGWFSTSGDDPSVLLRLKEDHDGAEPAASSVSVASRMLVLVLAPMAWAIPGCIR